MKNLSNFLLEACWTYQAFPQSSIYSEYERRQAYRRTFALSFSQIISGGDLVSVSTRGRAEAYQHMGVAQYYDIPSLSVRNTILHRLLENRTELVDYFVHNKEDPLELDLRHASPIHFSSLTPHSCPARVIS